MSFEQDNLNDFQNRAFSHTKRKFVCCLNLCGLESSVIYAAT